MSEDKFGRYLSDSSNIIDQKNALKLLRIFVDSNNNIDFENKRIKSLPINCFCKLKSKLKNKEKNLTE